MGQQSRTNKRCVPYVLVPFGLMLIAGEAAASASTTDRSGQLKQMSLEELMDVEVTSVSRRPEKLGEAASAIQVVTQEDIHRSGAVNIPEALRLAPNLQVAQVNASQWAISARGFDNVLANKLLVMIDGRTVYTPLYAGVFWDVQNTILEDVDRIEVVSGPGGTLWGANAVNGVINITSKRARDTQGLFVSGGAGDDPRNFGELRYGGQLTSNTYFRVYGKVINYDDTLLLSGADANDAWGSKQGGFRADWELDSNQLTLQSDLYEANPNPDGTTAVKASGGNLLSRWRHTISDSSDLQLQFYYDHTKRDFSNGFLENLGTYDLDGQHRFLLTKNQELIWGLGARWMDHQVDNLALFKFLPAHKTLHLYSAFVQDEIRLLENSLRFTIGSKFEHNDYTGMEVQPNVRVAWSPAEEQTVWAAISRAVRTPARIDRDFYLNITPTIPLISGADFESESVLAYELGWRSLFIENVPLSISTFYNEYDDLRSAEPGPPPLGIPLTFGNGVQGRSYGVELSATYSATANWRLRGGYTFLKKDLEVKQTSRDLNNASAESNDPQNQFLLQSLLDLPANLKLDAVVRYVDHLTMPDVDSHVDIDLRLAWNLTANLELSVVGQNLLDATHQEFVPASPSPREIERTFYGEITWRR